jgi:hypothetical protein
MKTVFLSMIGALTLFVNVSPFTCQTHAALQPQPLPRLYVIPAQEDSVIIGPQGESSQTSLHTNATLFYDLVQELQTFPVGKKYSYYRQTFEQQGYLVLDNHNDTRHWEFALEKEQQQLRLTIAYDAATGKSTMLTASGPRLAEVEHVHYTPE